MSAEPIQSPTYSQMAQFIAQSALKYVTQDPAVMERWKRWVYSTQVDAGAKPDDADWITRLDRDTAESWMIEALKLMDMGTFMHESIEAAMSHVASTIVGGSPFHGMSGAFGLSEDVEGEPSVDTQTSEDLD